MSMIRSFISKLIFSRHRSHLGAAPDTCIIHHSAYISKPERVFLGDKARIQRLSYLELGSKESFIKIGKNSNIHPNAMLRTYQGSITIGNHCSLNPFCLLLSGEGNITIGDDVRIAGHATIVASEHIFDDRKMPIRKQGVKSEGIVIHDDVWIGTHVTILDGVTIGQGAIIGAGAVVTKSVEPYAVMAGVPARKIKQRP